MSCGLNYVFIIFFWNLHISQLLAVVVTFISVNYNVKKSSVINLYS